MMDSTFFLIVSLLVAASTESAQCENGWVTYKDVLCIKAFTNLLTYDEAKDFCISQSNEISKASLVMVKEERLQEVLTNYTNDIYNTLWLGGKYDGDTEQYLWEDGEPLTYTNWQDDYPRNSTDSACMEIRPINAFVNFNAGGKWADVSCLKRNQVMCQRDLTWTLQDAVDEIMRIRNDFQDQLDNAANARSKLVEDLERTEQNLQTVSSLVIPVGSIYIEYFNQPSPPELWPSLTWEDISGTYAGLFFRTAGGPSESWGVTQNECAPRLAGMSYANYQTEQGANPLTIPPDGWSVPGWTGVNGPEPTTHYETLRFNTEGCEVRPRNQAIRIWKRTS